MESQVKRTENIYLFVPNIIDYMRIVLALISFYYMPTDPVKASVLYIVSALLDAVDGHFARMLNQTSKFGAMLDQLTDRVVTMCLCAVLCHFYSSYMLFFQCIMAVDIFSHWMHVQGSAIRGDSHKNIDLSANPILRHYYHNKIILFIMCSANELFFCGLYLCHFFVGPAVPILGVGIIKLVTIMCCPLALIKNAISLVQLGAACENYVIMDREERAAVAEAEGQVKDAKKTE